VARPATLTKTDFLDAGLAIIDTEGLDALTFRRLGDSMGISHTAVHTYFANRNELVNAIAQRLATEMFKSIDLSDASPRGLIIAIAMAARRSLARHPRLIPAFLTLDSDSVTGKDETIAVLSVLESGGVPKRSTTDGIPST
jgi:TetR/AcrR family transcriptional regulator, tetracycline repressor protein